MTPDEEMTHACNCDCGTAKVKVDMATLTERPLDAVVIPMPKVSVST